MKIGKARLCLDCDNLFHIKHKACPHCGSTSWVPLTCFVPSLRGSADEQEIRESYRPEPEPIPSEESPRRFFARAWMRLTHPLAGGEETRA
jgi:hypothetical protein